MVIVGAMTSQGNDGEGSRVRRWWISAGPLLFVLALLAPLPDDISPAGQATLAMALWMATWWLTVAVPLAVTALLPLVLLPAMGVTSPTSAAQPYANPVIFLFMGGFFIAATMQRWSLHRRVALAVVARTGTSPRRLVGGFMLASALLSMWMSNTAATLMMMPIGVAVLGLIYDAEDAGGAGDATAADGAPDRLPASSESRGLGVALMLGIAYAGSIGGVATLIGTPPNAVLAAMADELLHLELSFARWLALALPVSLSMLVVSWLLLCRVLFRLAADPIEGARRLLAAERAKLGPWHPGERVTAMVFTATAVAWILREPKAIGDLEIPGIQTWLPQVGDATIAIAAALILFLWPAKDRLGRPTRVLDWSHARAIPWDILILFGGGLSLASAFESSGLTTWLGGKLAVLAGLPDTLIITAVAATFVFVTEITSNTATATLGLPVMAALGPSVGVPPMALMTAAAMGASMAFMLPVATPPNAIVFGTGYIEPGEMRRAGLWLNIVAIAVVSAMTAMAFG